MSWYAWVLVAVAVVAVIVFLKLLPSLRRYMRMKSM